MLKYFISSQFKKDYKKCIKSPNRNIKDLQKIMEILASQQIIDEKYKDHSLKGNYRGYRECHIYPDWLLIYSIEADQEQISFVRTGSHSELFKK